MIEYERRLCAFRYSCYWLSIEFVSDMIVKYETVWCNPSKGTPETFLRLLRTLPTDVQVDPVRVGVAEHN